MRPDGPRDPTAGPDNGPEKPFPLRLDGKVIKGFGRGSKEVCIDSLRVRRSFAVTNACRLPPVEERRLAKIARSRRPCHYLVSIRAWEGMHVVLPAGDPVP